MIWASKFNAYFGTTLTGDHARMWFDELTDRSNKFHIRGLTEHEITEAVRYASAFYNGRKPALAELRGFILKHRAQGKSERSGSDADNAEYMHRVKRELRRLETDMDRWNFFCSPEKDMDLDRTTTVEECQELEAWAVDNCGHDIANATKQCFEWRQKWEKENGINLNQQMRNAMREAAL